MVRIFLSAEDNSGVTLYRQYWPWKHCKGPLAEQGIELIAGGPATDIPPSPEDDIYHYGRAPKGNEMPLFYFISKGGRRMLWDLEDNYLAIPLHFKCHEASVQTNTKLVLSMQLDLSDHITVVSEPLKAFVEDFVPSTKGKITVLPNLLDADYFKATRPRVGPPRILWAGGDSHAPDLKMIEPVFERIVNETDWTIVYMGDPGMVPTRVLKLPTERVLVYGFTNARSFPSVLCDLGADVGLCPLTGTEFDRSKTAIKWMEYSLAGLATVATDFGPYADAMEHGRTGYLLPTTATPDEWFVAINRAIVHRRELHAAAYAEVMAKHVWQSPEARQPWIDFYIEQAALIKKSA